jgi:hypothetical protein
MWQKTGFGGIPVPAKMLLVVSCIMALQLSGTMGARAADTEPPVAVYFTDETTVFAGYPMEFNATGSTDNLGIVSYTWNFGDGTANMTGNATFASVVSHIFAAAGCYSVSLEVADRDGNANRMSRPVVITPLPVFADLRMSHLGFSDSKPVAKKTVRISVTVGNLGEKAAANFTVRFMDGSRKIKDVNVAGLDIGASKRVSVDWAPKEGDHAIKVWADVLQMIPESNETNNEIKSSRSVADAPFLGLDAVTAALPVIIVLAAVLAVTAYTMFHPRKRS